MKQVLSLLIVAVLASSAIAAPIQWVTVADYSGRLGSSWVPENTLDKDPGTFWYSELSNDVASVPYIVYQIDAVQDSAWLIITMNSGNTRKLDAAEVSISTDGVNYTSVGLFEVDTADGAISTFEIDDPFMYVRLDCVRAHYNNWNGDPVDKATPGTAPDGKYAVAFAEAVIWTPEPATIGFLALGGMAVLRRRRA